MKVRITSLGLPVSVPGLTPKALNALTLLSKTVRHIITDFDDTLVDGGIGTEHNKMSQDEFIEINSKKILEFRKVCDRLTTHNINFGICTGRSGSFIIPWMNALFSPGVCDVIIGEGGATIHRFIDGNWELFTPKCVDPESLKIFMSNRDKVVEIGTTLLHGYYETGKLIIASFNPPILANGQVMKIEEYYSLFEIELDKAGLLGKIAFKHSNTAVDIGPLGADKVDAMLEITNGDPTAYAGDSMNDKSAMFQCLINLCPSNISSDFRKESSQAMCCLFSRLKVMDGVIDLFKTILKLLEKDY